MQLGYSRPVAYDDLQTHMLPERSTIVHLFEWKWKDVADECERFLGPKGYGGVQISPPTENAILHLDDGSRPWYERYQVVSYNLVTRSGNEEEFLDMTRRCNKVGVRVYADVVVNHMTAGEETARGTAGNTADPHTYSYPAVPYDKSHFHDACSIKSYFNATQVRNCQLEGLRDLNQSIPYVRDKIVEYINKLIDLGVAGIRIDAAKHMWPKDLKDIYNNLKDLNTEFGFPPNSRPYIFQEVIDYSDEAVKPYEYIGYGAVTEFKVGSSLTQCFRGLNALKWLANWGEAWNLLPSNRALVFIDNHDSQRTLPFLNYKEPKAYKAATAFMLAHPYGQTRVMCSYSFSDGRQGPPSDDQENLVTPLFNENNVCYNGWIAEHRWRQIYQMVGFRNVVRGTNVENWWDNGNNQISFSRGNKGFVVFNVENSDLDVTLQTGLPTGDYCDIISGQRIGNVCTGHKVTVGEDGRAHVVLSANAEDAMLAIHVGPESNLQVPARS